MERNSKNSALLVGELRRLWAGGAPPSELLRHLLSKGIVGGWALSLMQEAFSLPLSKTGSITAWLYRNDDARVNRLLPRFMPARDPLKNNE